MSTALFPCAFLRPPAADYSESTPYLEESERSQGGHFAGINRAQDQHFRCAGTVRLPQGETTFSTFDAFVLARSGVTDTFLYKPVLSRNRVVTGGALGTGAGVATVFAFSAGTNLHRHIVNGDHSDNVTLKVYVAGALQTLTTHYTVSLNDSDPTITFVAAPTGALTVSYELYVPCRFSSTDFGVRVLSRKKSDGIDFEEVVELGVALEEDRPGRRFAA